MSAPAIPCPTCGTAAPWSKDNPWRPFCSERCKLVDLGDWLTGNYRIPGEPADIDGPDTPSGGYPPGTPPHDRDLQ